MSQLYRLVYFLLVLTSFAWLTACESAPKKQDTTTQIPSKIALTAEDTPEAVKRIEKWIDSASVIMADEIDIVVSKNYQFELSVVGGQVSSDLNRGGIHERVATGGATAFFRNLRLKADNKMRVRIADVGTRPFLKITAKGNCSHIIVGETEPNSEPNHEVKRVEILRIQDEHILYR